MGEGRTYWLALDARWLAREGVVAVREEHGHAAVTVLIALMCAAKLENDGGRVSSGFRSLAREAFLEGGAEEARAVVESAARVGVLSDLVCGEEGLFTVRLVSWRGDQHPFEGRPHIPNAVRRAVMARDSSCRSCGTTADLQLDHIVPFSHGGSDTEDNLQALCGPCNRKKGARR